MRPALAPGGLLLIGEPFWREEPPGEAHAALDLGADAFTSLPGTLERFEAAGLELLEMVLADGNSWDRYVAAQWWTVAAGWTITLITRTRPRCAAISTVPGAPTSPTGAGTSAGACSCYGRRAEDGRHGLASFP